MNRFPETVRDAMSKSGASATCIPVRLGSLDWETAVYFQVSGPECKRDRRILGKSNGPVPIGMEADLIEHENASIVVLRLEVHTVPDDPLAGEILLTVGDFPAHFDTVRLLTHQPRLCWFFGDLHYWILHAQEHPLSPAQHEGFAQILHDAVRHDALVRMTSRYDANAALSAVVSRYELRAGMARGVAAAGTRNRN